LKSIYILKLLILGSILKYTIEQAIANKLTASFQTPV